MPPQRGRRTWPLNAIGAMNDFSDVLPLVAPLLSQHYSCVVFSSLSSLPFSCFFLSFLSESIGFLSSCLHFFIFISYCCKNCFTYFFISLLSHHTHTLTVINFGICVYSLLILSSIPLLDFGDSDSSKVVYFCVRVVSPT